ncbi:MAG: ABC transporter permease [Verrucomicrobiae bacterium]|nr:ABC transporter permease [Verrucomicrobiae bacterium]
MSSSPFPVQLLKNHRREAGMLALLFVLIIWTTIKTIEPGVDGLFGSKFLTLDNFKNVSRTIGIFGIFSIGVGIVIITSGIDLSIGSLMALLGILFFYGLTGSSDLVPEMSWPLAVLMTLTLGLAIGLLHGWLVGKLKLQAFVVTLCGLLSYRGIARFISHDSTVGSADAVQDISYIKMLCTGSVGDLLQGKDGSGILYSLPMSLVYLAIISVVMMVVLHRSVFGRYLYASGRNELATKYSGINTGLVIATAYAISGLFAATAAIPYAIYTSSVSPSTHGAFFELYAIAGAVLGGCSLRGGEGSILGILIGTTILIVLQNMVNLLGYESSLSDAITGGVIFFGVLGDQVGIKGVQQLFRKITGKGATAVGDGD